MTFCNSGARFIHLGLARVDNREEIYLEANSKEMELWSFVKVTIIIVYRLG